MAGQLMPISSSNSQANGIAASTAAVIPAAKPTLAEQAYVEIRRMILESQLPAKMVVSERLLADAVKLGKAPIRAAVARLAAEGLISIAPRQGIVIAYLSLQDLLDVYETRLVIEPYLAGQVARTIQDHQVRRLQENLGMFRQASQSGNMNDGLTIDFTFHRLLAEFHGNAHLATVLDRIFDVIYREVKVAKVFRDRQDESIREHQSIADAIINRQPELAASRLEAHIHSGRRTLLGGGERHARK